jgi:hypothetical protein
MLSPLFSGGGGGGGGGGGSGGAPLNPLTAVSRPEPDTHTLMQPKPRSGRPVIPDVSRPSSASLPPSGVPSPAPTHTPALGSTAGEPKKGLDPLDELLLSLKAKADAETKEREEQARLEREERAKLEQQGIQTPFKPAPVTPFISPVVMQNSPFSIPNPFAPPVFTPELAKESAAVFSAMGMATKLATDDTDAATLTATGDAPAAEPKVEAKAGIAEGAKEPTPSATSTSAAEPAVDTAVAKAPEEKEPEAKASEVKPSEEKAPTMTAPAAPTPADAPAPTPTEEFKVSAEAAAKEEDAPSSAAPRGDPEAAAKTHDPSEKPGATSAPPPPASAAGKPAPAKNPEADAMAEILQEAERIKRDREEAEAEAEARAAPPADAKESESASPRVTDTDPPLADAKADGDADGESSASPFFNMGIGAKEAPKKKSLLSDPEAFAHHIAAKYEALVTLRMHRQDEQRRRGVEAENTRQEAGTSSSSSSGGARGAKGSRARSAVLRKGLTLHLGGGAVGYEADALATAGYSQHVGMWRGYPFDSWTCCGTSDRVCPRSDAAPSGTDTFSTTTTTTSLPARRHAKRSRSSDDVRTSASGDRLVMTAKSAAMLEEQRRRLRRTGPGCGCHIRPQDSEKFLATFEGARGDGKEDKAGTRGRGDGDLRREYMAKWRLVEHSGRDRAQEHEEVLQQRAEIKAPLAAQAALRMAYTAPARAQSSPRRWRSPNRTGSSLNQRAATFPASGGNKRVWMPAYERTYNVRAAAAERHALQATKVLASSLRSVTDGHDDTRRAQKPSYGQFMTDVLSDTAATVRPKIAAGVGTGTGTAASPRAAAAAAAKATTGASKLALVPSRLIEFERPAEAPAVPPSPAHSVAASLSSTASVNAAPFIPAGASWKKRPLSMKISIRAR